MSHLSENQEITELARLHQRLKRAKHSQLSDRPVRQTFRARHEALQRSRRVAAARAAEAHWQSICPHYREAIDAGLPEDAVIVTSNGLTLALPDTATGGVFVRRLQDGWLPWRDIVAQRELGLGDVMLDIGANVGTTSLLRVVAGDVQRVYALEPEPANFACLVHNIRANGLAGFVLPDAYAASSADGVGILRHSKGLGSHRLMTGPKAREGRRDTITVPSIRLDDWVRERGIEIDAIAFVKLDTQGWESHVLAGAEQLLAARHVAWILEVSPKHLTAAGTPLPHLLSQVARHFTHAIDLRGDRTRSRVVAVDELPAALAYLGTDGPITYTNLALYHES